MKKKMKRLTMTKEMIKMEIDFQAYQEQMKNDADVPQKEEE